MLTMEFDFLLPRGLVDAQGMVHRQGVMRLATARDELSVQNDRRVLNNPGYSSLVMLARVITRLGSLADITPEQLENLFTLDIAYLREFYDRINQQGTAQVVVQCPKCTSEFMMELAFLGEQTATP